MSKVLSMMVFLYITYSIWIKCVYSLKLYMNYTSVNLRVPYYKNAIIYIHFCGSYIDFNRTELTQNNK